MIMMGIMVMCIVLLYNTSLFVFAVLTGMKTKSLITSVWYDGSSESGILFNLKGMLT